MAQRENNSKVLIWVGLAFLAVAAIIYLGFFAFSIVSEDEFPPMLAVMIGSGVIGFCILLGAVIRDRIQQRKTENLEEVDY